MSSNPTQVKTIGLLLSLANLPVLKKKIPKIVTKTFGLPFSQNVYVYFDIKCVLHKWKCVIKLLYFDTLFRFIYLQQNYIIILNVHKWRPPSLNKLTPVIFHMELTHLGSKASIYIHFKRYIINIRIKLLYMKS